MADRNRTTPRADRARAPVAENRTGYELAGELGPQGAAAAVPPSTERDPQQTHAAGPDLWGAPD